MQTRTRALAAIVVALLGGAALTQGAAATGAPRQNVAVCIEKRINRDVSEPAEIEAALIFHRIGVTLHWHAADSPFCRTNKNANIHIAYSLKTAVNVDPGVLAFANPYRASVEVYYDRIPATGELASAHILAHILAHEISHILQGVARHSDAGMMKARWTNSEYAEMRWHFLEFTEFDISLIHSGLEARNNGKLPAISEIAADTGASVRVTLSDTQ